MKKTCPKCGKPMSENAKFCANCGNNMSNENKSKLTPLKIIAIGAAISFSILFIYSMYDENTLSEEEKNAFFEETGVNESTETRKDIEENVVNTTEEAEKINNNQTETSNYETQPQETEEEPVNEYIEEETASYDGNGDDVIDISAREHAFVLYIKGNESGRHFSVKGYDETGNQTELFVNTSDPYEGITIDPYLTTKTLEITAVGSWHIEQRDISTLDMLTNGQTYSGNGDSVLLYKEKGNTAAISGNADGRFFMVKSYGNDGESLMVNASDPYDGKTMLKYDPFMFEIKAIGDWSITIE